MAQRPSGSYFQHLLVQVDMALDKLTGCIYGLCETCQEPIQNDRLWVDPLAQNCLSHLSLVEQERMECDLALAYRIAKIRTRRRIDWSGCKKLLHQKVLILRPRSCDFAWKI